MKPVGTAASWKASPQGADYEAVRGRLVDAAESVIRDQGVAALRLDSVAEQVGLHRSSLYRYVDSKEALVTAVAVQATLRIGRQVIERIGADASPEELLVEGITEALAAIAEDPVHQSLMAPAASESMSRIAGTALSEGILPLVEPMFTAAADRGVLREGVTPELAVSWLQVVSSGLLRSPNLVADPDELRTLLSKMLVPALIDSPD
jgi:AcrR family transcriptional regulator